MAELPPQYQPQPVEQRWYPAWESRGLFHVEPRSSTPRHDAPYTIVIPPPNVTGILHMGHALNNTIQDVLIRWQRMQGHPTLWVPGTDHAGIATQNVVERMLAKEGTRRHDIGREAFVQRVWQWKEEYGNTIITQLKRLGASCDWQRTRFTMDEGLSRAVREVFVRLYEEGLIYRGNYIVNWCPRCETALSDEEAPHKPVDGKLYYIRYPLARSERSTLNYLVIATTRPETMLGDTAIAVHPKDTRYKALIGREAVLPLVGRRLRIIADDCVDPTFGTGAVKVTPAHDPNDFAMAKRHQLDIINIMTPTAHMEHVPRAYQGQDRVRCRQTVLEDLQQEDVLEKQEAHQHNVSHCYRCDTVVEPRLSLQWFVKMAPLARPAIDAVKTGHITFHPARWTKVYLNWMDHIQDWCISRQIWWGHRIPVWYCDRCVQTSSQHGSESRVQSHSENPERSTLNAQPRTPGLIVAREAPAKCPACGSTALRQDEDVLDTWFSSWLWPMSTLGWPEETPDLKYFYPTSVLVTAQEIIFFWVARMIMSGLHFRKAIPFRDVYIHGTVRDLTGRKMSKSLGNIIDPLDIIEKFGCDALRFSLITAQAVGADVFIGDEKFVVGRNFANKLWNVTRFVLASVPAQLVREELPAPARLDLIDRWIVSRLQHVTQQATQALERYRLSEASMRLYDFIWRDVCDWYVELAKRRLADPATQEHTATILVRVLEQSLRLLHPVMPFVTEELWQHLRAAYGPTEGAPRSIMTEAWPAQERRLIDMSTEKAMTLTQAIIVAVRKIRADFQIRPDQQLIVHCAVPQAQIREMIASVASCVAPLARIERLVLTAAKERMPHAATALVDHVEVSVPLEGLIDLAQERQRLTQQRDDVARHLQALQARLGKRDFLKRAPKAVVAKERERAMTLEQQHAALEHNLAALD